MKKIAIIGGTGLSTLKNLAIQKTCTVHTPYGDPSDILTIAKFAEQEIIFLPRHGNAHTIPPHKINYRANIHALKQNDVEAIIAVNAVGGITAEMYPGRIAIPSQIIDYTYAREHTFYTDNLAPVQHIDFSYPYSNALRKKFTTLDSIKAMQVFLGGVYAATQGPRLETAAEIDKLEKDGCDIVGMTGMPEAALARELDIQYIAICLVVNWAAGKTNKLITIPMIEQHLTTGMDKIQLILQQFIATH